MNQNTKNEQPVKPKDDISTTIVITGSQYCKSVNQTQAIGRTNRPLSTAIKIIYLTTFGKFP